SAWCRLSA
ncbi:glutamate decarboxylase, partial [Escherichia coli EC1849]